MFEKRFGMSRDANVKYWCIEVSGRSWSSYVVFFMLKVFRSGAKVFGSGAKVFGSGAKMNGIGAIKFGEAVVFGSGVIYAEVIW